MGMNIKNPKTQALAKELATLTGESQTEAITHAPEERLAKLKRAGIAERLREISKRTGPLFQGKWKTIDHADLLYDENGMPK
jgi:antitoxin VapB